MIFLSILLAVLYVACWIYFGPDRADRTRRRTSRDYWRIGERSLSHRDDD